MKTYLQQHLLEAERRQRRLLLQILAVIFLLLMMLIVWNEPAPAVDLTGEVDRAEVVGRWSR